MDKKSFIVIGLGFGDEGKGSVVDYLVRETGCKYVVRFNGGSQAAHNVVLPNGVHHCFAQFGSGTFAGSKTILSKFMLINPINLLTEASYLIKAQVNNVINKLIIDENCPIITPFNSILNKILELSKGRNKNGSCGHGVGLTQSDVLKLGENALYAKDLINKTSCTQKLNSLYSIKLNLARKNITCKTSKMLLNRLEEYDISNLVSFYFDFASHLKIVPSSDILQIINNNSCIFEGAQGAMLDQKYGAYPYVTRSNTTFENALNLISSSGFDGEVVRVGLLRAYATRHGKGPFVTEDKSLKIPACHNKKGKWQGKFRIGWFDAFLAKYALNIVNGIDVLGITNLDRLNSIPKLKVCTNYSPNKLLSFASLPVYEEINGWDLCSMKDINFVNYLQFLEEKIGREISLISTSPTYLAKKQLSKKLILI
ncbi:MAG: adenylosuccinate synthetase [Candidatus Nanoarchaeia archaeon]